MTLVEEALQPDPSIRHPPGDQVSDNLVRTLPGSAYSSPEVFAAEQEKIFEQMWLCVARASELPKAGDFQTVQLGRESVIVSRNRKGQLRAFFNVCRHRGARICAQDSGSGKRSFQCAYHAWTYDLDGRLVAAYESWPRADGGLAFTKYSPHGWVLRRSKAEARPGRKMGHVTRVFPERG